MHFQWLLLESGLWKGVKLYKLNLRNNYQTKFNATYTLITFLTMNIHQESRACADKTNIT